MMNRNIFYLTFPACTIFLLFILAGCGSVSQESVLMKNLQHARMNSAEVSIRINEIGSRYCLGIENAADKIIAEANDLRSKKNALLWKIYGIPAVIKTISIQDPIASASDTWVLLAQMRQFFEDGNGKDLFGDHQKIAIDETKKMEDGMVALAREFSDSAMVTRSSVKEWVDEHPVEDIMFNRTSTVVLQAKALSRKQLDLTSSMGDMVTSVRSLQDRLTLYADFLPKQARWQAEYLIYELLPDSLNGEPFENFDIMAASIERISRTIEASPELISSFQESVMRDINQQRILTIESLGEERKVILEAVRAERISMLKEIDKQRKATLDDIAVLTDRSISSSGSMLVNVADKILIRLVILLLAGFILGYLFIRLTKRGIEKP